MTLSAAIRYNRLGWRGYENPAFPIGAWRALALAVGDASAGLVENSVVFRSAGEPASALVFSVEQIAIQTTDNGDTTLGIQTSGFDLLFQQGLQWQNIGTVAQVAGGSLRLPWFLGMLDPVAGGGADLTVLSSNTLNAVYTANMMGYIWDQRSQQAPGGIQRPVTSPWGL